MSIDHIDHNTQFDKAANAIIRRFKAPEQNFLFITGKAGTGKSTLIEYVRDKISDKFVILAPTGVAALNVRGQTIHSFFRFKKGITTSDVHKIRLNANVASLFKTLSVIVIDEISMVRADLLDCVNEFLKLHGPVKNANFGGVNMVFIGDLYQLPPVVTSDAEEIFRTIYKSPYFFSANALCGIKFEFIELEKVYRQRNRAFVELLNRVRNNSITPDDLILLNKRIKATSHPPKDRLLIILTTTRQNAEDTNRVTLSKLTGKEYISRAKISGDFHKESYPTADKLSFKVGAQIMMVNNDPQKRWVNGSIGIVQGIDVEKKKISVRLQDNGQTALVEYFTWKAIRYSVVRGRIETEEIGEFKQMPFILAWAVTIHKSQGKTFDYVMIDLERGAFAAGQTYVALSRCRSLEGVFLVRPIDFDSIYVDQTIREFLTGLQYRNSEEQLPIYGKMQRITSAIDSQQEIEMTYLKPDDTKTKRTVIPISLNYQTYHGVHFWGMLAFCKLRRADRTFRVDRILEMTVISKSDFN